MKHLLFLIVALVLAYAMWQVTDPKERSTFMKMFTHHGLRIGALVGILLLLVYAASALPSSSLI
jgi:xanthine/uracil permease